ncbi:hypothetical protein EON81_14955, partial [bacterium]
MVRRRSLSGLSRRWRRRKPFPELSDRRVLTSGSSTCLPWSKTDYHLPMPQSDPNPQVKKAKTPTRREKGTGGVERRGKRFRAKKTISGQPLVGPWRDSWDSAHADIAGLTLAPAPERPDCPTLRDFMIAHLEGRRKKEISEGTWIREEIIWRTRVWPSAIGKKRLDDITEDDCQEFVDSLEWRIRPVPKLDENGKIVWIDKARRKMEVASYEELDIRLEPEGIKRIAVVVGTYLQAAKGRRYKHIQHNPFREADIEWVKANKDVKRKRRSLTPSAAARLPTQLFQFAAAMKGQGDRFAAMVLLARDTGMRRGEICALKWDMVQRGPSGPYLVVEKGLARGFTGVQEKGTKTGSVRDVPISEDTWKEIKKQPRRAIPKRNAQGEIVWKNAETKEFEIAGYSDYVFTTEEGNPVKPDRFGKQFRVFRDSIGMPDLK